MTENAAARAAALLVAARRDRKLLDALPEDLRPADMNAAYAVQDALVAALGGERNVRGWKVGATNAAAQSMLGASEPFCGRLFDAATRRSGTDVPAGELFRRGVEVEFAFRLGRSMPAAGAPWTRETAAEAVAALHPAVEIVDSRFAAGLKAGALALVADNGAHGAFRFGPAMEDWRGLDLPNLRTELWVNGERATEGSGANVLGHPLEPLAWLANHRAARGAGLREGELIATGSTCARVVFAEPGDSISARFKGLGEVSFSFR